MKVALVCMPVTDVARPSLQLGLLKAILQRHSIPVDTHHLNVDFAQRVGIRECELVGTTTVGEWVGSYALFGEIETEAAFLERFAPNVEHIRRELGWELEDFVRLRREVVPEFLDACVANVPWHEYDVVGFSSTAQQQVFSLALARRIKAAWPRIQIVLGGASLQGPMGREHFRAWPWIDHVCLGEGDETFPELIRRLDLGDLGAGVPGFLSRVGQTVLDGGTPPMFERMDDLPDPDYDEYFERIRRWGHDYERLRPSSFNALPIETSRGCWWGEKHICVFCGAFSQSAKFRSRSASQVLDQVERLSRRYGTWRFAVVDNIMDRKYIRELFSTLADRAHDFTFWYESKANLSLEELRILCNGGIGVLQPGIESLSSPVLRLMGKGVSALANVNTLKWARYFGVEVKWNLLVGFPGERAEDYVRMTDMMRKLAHLMPPEHCGTHLLQRFSPHFEHPERFGLMNKRPSAFNHHVYPSDQVDIERIAYFFEYDNPQMVSDDVLLSLLQCVVDWKTLWKSEPYPDLVYFRSRDRLLVVDSRDPRSPRKYELTGDALEVFLACEDRPHKIRAICERVERAVTDPTDVEARVGAALRSLKDAGLVLEDEGSYLSVAVPVHRNVERVRAGDYGQYP